jgi:hypothetical protein
MPYPVSLKSTKLASLRLAIKLPGAQGLSKHYDIYKIETLGVQERRKGVVYIERRQEGSRGCTGYTGTLTWTEGGLSTGEQSRQEFVSSAGGSIAGEQGDGSSLGGKGVDKGSAGARGINGVTD